MTTKTQTILAFVTKKPGCSAADVMTATKIDSANTQGFLKSLLKQGKIAKAKAEGKVTWTAVDADKPVKAAKAKAEKSVKGKAKKPAMAAQAKRGARKAA